MGLYYAGEIRAEVYFFVEMFGGVRKKFYLCRAQFR